MSIYYDENDDPVPERHVARNADWTEQVDYMYEMPSRVPNLENGGLKEELQQQPSSSQDEPSSQEHAVSEGIGTQQHQPSDGEGYSPSELLILPTQHRRRCCCYNCFFDREGKISRIVVHMAIVLGMLAVVVIIGFATWELRGRLM